MKVKMLDYSDEARDSYKDATLVGFNPYHCRYMVLCDDGTFHGYAKRSHFETDKEIGAQFKYRLPFVEEIDGKLVYEYHSHQVAANRIKEDTATYTKYNLYMTGDSGKDRVFNNFEDALNCFWNIDFSKCGNVYLCYDYQGAGWSGSGTMFGYENGEHFLEKELSARQKKLYLKKYFGKNKPLWN